jgi:hypothetical protein
MPSRYITQARQPTGTDLLAVPECAVAVAERQAGVLSRAQLGALGFTASQVRGAVGARRWRAVGRSVVVLGNGPLTAAQRDWVAVLLPGQPAALAGLSAAAASGLCGFEPDRVHVVVRHATHVAAPGWVKLHESRRFTAADISAAAPPRTPVSRSVIDGATWSKWPRRACAILCAAVQQRLVSADALLAELRRAGRVRHVRIMRDILGDIGGGGHTLAEIELAPIAIRAGLPAPRRQVLRREPGGKVRYVDAEFDLPDGRVLAVEIDGSAHQEAVSWWDDLDRQNEIIIGGRPLLRYPSIAVRLGAPRVEDQLRRIRIAHAPR